MGIRFQFCKMKKFWRSVQQCEDIKHYSTAHLKMVKMVNFVVCFIFYTTVLKKKSEKGNGGKTGEGVHTCLESKCLKVL